MNTATATPATKTTKSRAEYGFELNFPSKPFTMKKLKALKGGKVQYITIYMRIKKALREGIIEVVGKQTPKTKRKGRQLLVYSRVNAKTTVVTATSSEVVPMSDLS